MMTDDEMKAIAERVDADEDYDMDDDEETDNRFVQACVDRKRLLDEVKRLRAVPAGDAIWHLGDAAMTDDQLKAIVARATDRKVMNEVRGTFIEPARGATVAETHALVSEIHGLRATVAHLRKQNDQLFDGPGGD